MSSRKGTAVWKGNLKNGKGTMKVESGTFEGAYNFKSRFGDGGGTNPEELIGAAHAGCFSMALSNELDEAGFIADNIATTADVHLEKTEQGFEIKEIVLNTEAKVPGIDEEEFFKQAENAKNGCPVSQALKGVNITLEANLIE